MLVALNDLRRTRVSMGRRSLRRSFVAALALGAASFTPDARATAPQAASSASGDEALQREAKARYDAGFAAYRDGRFEAAIAAFVAADQLLPRPALSYNIAKAYARLDDTAHALSYFREYLRRDPDAPNGAEVRRAIARLEHALSARQLQQLTVLTTPSGATVTIDGREMGLTPWTGELRPGQHQLALALAQSGEQVFSIELPRERALELSMRLTPYSEAPPVLGSTSAGLVQDAAVPVRRNEKIFSATPPPAAHEGPHPALLVAGGALALAGAGMGLGFELAAQKEDDALARYRAELGPAGCTSADNAPACDAVRAAAKRYDRDRTLSLVGFATASTAAVGTLVYWLWSGTRATSSGATATRHLAGVRIDGAATASSGTIQLSGSF